MWVAQPPLPGYSLAYAETSDYAQDKPFDCAHDRLGSVFTSWKPVPHFAASLRYTAAKNRYFSPAQPLEQRLTFLAQSCIFIGFCISIGFCLNRTWHPQHFAVTGSLMRCVFSAMPARLMPTIVRSPAQVPVAQVVPEMVRGYILGVDCLAVETCDQ